VTIRSLTSLKWPLIPDAPSYDDPLTKNEVKRLELPHYEAIATSPNIREALINQRLRQILRILDGMRDNDREEALQVLVAAKPSTGHPFDDEDVKVFRAFALAVEDATKGIQSRGQSGLDWEA